MAKRHHVTMETGGWILLAIAILALLWLLFSESGNQFLTGVVTVKANGVPVPASAQNPAQFPLIQSTCPSGYSAALDVHGAWQCVRNDQLAAFEQANLIGAN